MGHGSIAADKNKFDAALSERRQHSGQIIHAECASRILEHLTEAQGFIVILKTLPGALRKGSLDERHVDPLRQP